MSGLAPTQRNPVATARRLASAVFASLLFAIPSSGFAGAVGAEIRVYPAGLIPSVRGELDLGSGGRVLGQAGYNATDRRDWGKHEDESGGGFGVGAGWMYPVSDGWIAGIRVDYWWLEIDWTDPGRSGSTSLGVLQPTAVAGYRWPAGRWYLDATLALGGEFNVEVDGEAVGEGWILLAGVGGVFSF